MGRFSVLKGVSNTIEAPASTVFVGCNAFVHNSLDSLPAVLRSWTLVLVVAAQFD